MGSTYKFYASNGVQYHPSLFRTFDISAISIHNSFKNGPFLHFNAFVPKIDGSYEWIVDLIFLKMYHFMFHHVKFGYMGCCDFRINHPQKTCLVTWLFTWNVTFWVKYFIKNWVVGRYIDMYRKKNPKSSTVRCDSTSTAKNSKIPNLLPLKF